MSFYTPIDKSPKKRAYRQAVSKEAYKYCKHYDEECVVNFNFMVGNSDTYKSLPELT